ncbi:MAG TPA: hypothetical protein VES89_05420 [Candidatus Competibacteraceae bacterium]|nr:hypothetical protein [Candidatus Competibacteraceae bacterium]
MSGSPYAAPVRPEQPQRPTARIGPAAMWKELADYKAAGMLAAWRYKWREFLP